MTMYEFRTTATYSGPHPTSSAPVGDRDWISHFWGESDDEARLAATEWLQRLHDLEDEVNRWGEIVHITELDHFVRTGDGSTYNRGGRRIAPGAHWVHRGGHASGEES